MWRITNILLLVFLVFALVAGGYVLYDDHLQYMDWGQDDKASRERTLNANETVDEEGRKLRTQAISFGTVLRFEPWGPWSVVTAEQSALATPLVTSADTIIVTGTRKGGGLLASAPNIYSRFTNNLVLRNGLDDSEKLLFTHKVAITNILAIPREQFPGIVAAYIDADTNGDGKIDEIDDTKVRLFRFDQENAVDISFTGSFSSFNAMKPSDGVFSFTTYLDLDENGEVDYDREPKRAFEVDVTTGAVHQLLSDDTVFTLQSIIDGPAGGE